MAAVTNFGDIGVASRDTGAAPAGNAPNGGPNEVPAAAAAAAAGVTDVTPKKRMLLFADAVVDSLDMKRDNGWCRGTYIAAVEDADDTARWQDSYSIHRLAGSGTACRAENNPTQQGAENGRGSAPTGSVPEESAEGAAEGPALVKHNVQFFSAVGITVDGRYHLGATGAGAGAVGSLGDEQARMFVLGVRDGTDPVLMRSSFAGLFDFVDTGSVVKCSRNRVLVPGQ